jgi:hypothetical protein
LEENHHHYDNQYEYKYWYRYPPRLKAPYPKKTGIKKEEW